MTDFDAILINKELFNKNLNELKKEFLYSKDFQKLCFICEKLKHFIVKEQTENVRYLAFRLMSIYGLTSDISCDQFSMDLVMCAEMINDADEIESMISEEYASYKENEISFEKLAQQLLQSIAFSYKNINDAQSLILTSINNVLKSK